jgi:hypothetical protein
MSEKMNWRDILKQMIEQAAEGNYDHLDKSEPRVIVIPQSAEDSVIDFLSELGKLGFEMPELDAIDTEIEKLIDAGKFVAFEDEESIH